MTERRGKVLVDGKEVLAWPEDGEQPQPQPEEEGEDEEGKEGEDEMGEERPASSSSSAALSRLGSRQGPPSKGPTNLNKEKELRPKTGSVKVGSGATARVVRLTDISQDPRPLRRRRRLPSNRALLPYDPFTATDEEWEVYSFVFFFFFFFFFFFSLFFFFFFFFFYFFFFFSFFLVFFFFFHLLEFFFFDFFFLFFI
jgi:hypothetical protein